MKQILKNIFDFNKFCFFLFSVIACLTTYTSSLHLNKTKIQSQIKIQQIASLENPIFLEGKTTLEKKKKKKGSISNSHLFKNKNSNLMNTNSITNFLENSEKKSLNSKWASGTLNTPPLAADKPSFKNDTLSLSSYRDINNTYVGQKINAFMLNQRKWDWKLLDKQLQEIAFDMNYQDDYGHTPEGLRAFIKYFIKYFENCDQDQDNLLSRSEFQNCLSTDRYLSVIDLPNSNYSALMVPPYNYSNPIQYANNIFDLLDPQDMQFLNFHSYMQLRLFIFSWRRCSVSSPFLEESNFECAIEIAAGWKSMSRTQARRLFFLALELSGNESLRNLDFVTFLSFAQAVRLFGKINGKEDNDVTRAQFNLALDNNVLPLRYNQDVIGYFFKLIEERDRPNQGIDLLTFVFYDFWLKLFHKFENTRSYYLTFPEFYNIFINPLYPKMMMEEIFKIPQNKLTSEAYQMYMYMNISHYQDESDHFLKSFIESSVEEKKIEKNLANKLETAVNAKRLGKKFSISEVAGMSPNLEFNWGETIQNLFSVIDADTDGYINFYDFGGLIQINYLFMKFDVYQKGRLVSADLYDNFTSYSNFPLVSYLIRERAQKFSLFPQDLYADFYSVLLTLKIEDIINTTTRKSDKTKLFEIEIKNILAIVNRQSIPDAYLNRCLRGVNSDNIPLYDWECAYIQSEIRTLTFFENSFDRLTVVNNQIYLHNTVFYNIDPNLPQPGSAPGEPGYDGSYKAKMEAIQAEKAAERAAAKAAADAASAKALAEAEAKAAADAAAAVAAHKPAAPIPPIPELPPSPPPVAPPGRRRVLSGPPKSKVKGF